MTTTIIPILAAMYLGSSFNLKTYEKGNADIFDVNTLEGKIRTINRSFTRSQYKLVETSNQAREFLDVSGALSLRVKKGDVEIGGTGAYLRETANRQKFVELLVRVQHETVTETIPSHLAPNTDWMLKPAHRVGTHFVRSIIYGGELIASLRLKANNREEREMIKAAVSANLQLTGTFDVNANGSFDKLRQDLQGMYNEEIKVMATKMPSSPPQTVEDLMKLVENYPKDITSINDGKGKALKAELYPLSSMKSDYPLYLPNNAISNLLDDVETKYDDIRITLAEIHPWNRDRPESTEEEDEQVEELFSMLQKAQSAFHMAIGEIDVTTSGVAAQFDKAFASYGTGKDNVPNRFQRLFWKLRQEITKEPIAWDKPPGSGAVYTNWGSKTCSSKSSTDTNVLYWGHAAGTSSNAWAGGRNFLCLPQNDPKLKPMPNAPATTAQVQTVQYRTMDDPGKTEFMFCAVCIAKTQVEVQTFVGMTKCPANWKLEYSGYLMADSVSYVDRDFMCLAKDISDFEIEIAPGENSPKMNLVWMNCEKCAGEKIVPCVVCTN